METVRGLRCRECGREYPLEATHVCEFCFGPLEVVLDLDAVRSSLSRALVSGGPPTMWRYAPLLPAPAERVDLGAGLTPLRPAPRLAAELGLRKLWIKNDGANPTLRHPAPPGQG